MVFTYPCNSGWLQTIHHMALCKGKESHLWRLSELVSTRIDQESEQLCSRQAEEGALMKLFKRPHGVSAGKRDRRCREPPSPCISVTGGKRSGPRNPI